MSVYAYFSVPPPVMAYAVMHRAPEGVSAADYTRSILEWQERLLLDSASVAAGYAKHMSEAMMRETDMLMNILSPFLHTPIRSDRDEVRKALLESLQRLQLHICGNIGPGLKYLMSGKVFVPPSKKAVERRMLQNGKAFLESRGFAFGRKPDHIYETVFVFEGGSNLDTLEYMMRGKVDGLLAWNTALGEPALATSVYTLVHAHGAFPTKEKMPFSIELCVFFDAGILDSPASRGMVLEVLRALEASGGARHASLWQRKLSLGGFEEYVVRLICDSAEAVGETISRMATSTPDPAVREALTGRGRLLVKELLF